MKSDLTQNPKVSPTEGLAKLSSYRNNPISSDYPMERGAIGSFGSRQTAALRICSEQREMGGASDLSTRAQGASGASPPPSPARDSIRSGPRPRRPTPGAQGPVPAASAPAGTRPVRVRIRVRGLQRVGRPCQRGSAGASDAAPRRWRFWPQPRRRLPADASAQPGLRRLLPDWRSLRGRRSVWGPVVRLEQRRRRRRWDRNGARGRPGLTLTNPQAGAVEFQRLQLSSGGLHDFHGVAPQTRSPSRRGPRTGSRLARGLRRR